MQKNRGRKARSGWFQLALNKTGHKRWVQCFSHFIHLSLYITKFHFVPKLYWDYIPRTVSSIYPVLSVYLTTILPPPSFTLSLSLQCFGRCPVAMQRPQQWPLSVRAHHCPRNAYLIVACFDRGNTKSCLPVELFHRLTHRFCPSGFIQVRVIGKFPRLMT